MAEPATASNTADKPLDEVLLAMDVVDTLRHRAQLVDQELNADARREDLLDRLREIYAAQGIAVPDHILEDGVNALEERRFSYQPPKQSLSVQLAKLYVSRDRWGRPLIYGAAGLAALFGGYQLLVAGPQKAKAAAIEAELSDTLPSELQSLYTSVSDLAEDQRGRALADALYADAQAAISDADVVGARAAISELETLRNDLSAVYEVRVRYRDGADSGFFRRPPNQPNQRNYYLVVEAIDARGNAIEVPIESEEASERARTDQWAQRVSRAAFDAVVEDKQDDAIIQNDVIGQKRRGRIEPDYVIDTPGGALLTW